MCHHAGFWGRGSWPRGRQSRLWECTGNCAVRVALNISLFFLCILLLCIVVPVPLICCSVKLPLSQPMRFLTFSFYSPPHSSAGRSGRATTWPFVAGHSKTATGSLLTHTLESRQLEAVIPYRQRQSVGNSDAENTLKLSDEGR